MLIIIEKWGLARYRRLCKEYIYSMRGINSTNLRDLQHHWHFRTRKSDMLNEDLKHGTNNTFHSFTTNMRSTRHEEPSAGSCSAPGDLASPGCMQSAPWCLGPLSGKQVLQERRTVELMASAGESPQRCLGFRKKENGCLWNRTTHHS